MQQGTLINRFENWLTSRYSLKKVGLVFFCGMLTAFSFAPFYISPILAVSYPLLLLVLSKTERLSDAFSFGWWFGFGQMFVGFLWIANAFEVDNQYPGWIGYFAVGGLAVLMALYSGISTGVYWKLFHKKDHQKYALPMVLTFVVLWNMAEWMRGHLFTGFPWNLAGYTWGFSDVMLQTASIWGIYGLGFITIFLALMPYLWLKMSVNLFPRLILASSVVLVIGGMVAYGTLQLSAPTQFNHDVKFKIVQANINQNDKWDPDKKADNFIKYLKMSKSTPEEGITHVIWPETAVVYFLDTEPSRRYLIADMLQDKSVLMTGFPRIKRHPSLQAWNSFISIDSDGMIGNMYDKFHLVPFGEYTPDFLSDSLSFLGLGMMADGFSYSRGEGVRTLHQEGMPPYGVLICYEIIFPGAIVNQNDRPEWLLNITNDAWYGIFSGPYQHLLQTRLRAIEEGIPIIRSAGTGISAVIDSYGRIINSLSLNKQGSIVSHMPVKRARNTFYSQNSSWVFWGIVILLLGIIFIYQRYLGGRI